VSQRVLYLVIVLGRAGPTPPSPRPSPNPSPGRIRRADAQNAGHRHIDRLLHHAHLCQTTGDSVRLSQALAGKECHDWTDLVATTRPFS